MKINMVVMHKGRYFGIDFSERNVKEVSFEEAYGSDFFDWDNMICMASEENKERYDEMRGKDGCGFGMICKMVCREVI